MKKSEFLFGLLALLALAFRFFAIDGSAALMVIALSALALLYFYLGFALFNHIPLRKMFKKESYREVSRMRLIGAIAAGIALSQTVVGILFQLLRWPGAEEMLRIGLISLAVVFLVAAIRYVQSKAAFYPSLLLRVGLLGGAGLVLVLQS